MIDNKNEANMSVQIGVDWLTAIYTIEDYQKGVVDDTLAKHGIERSRERTVHHPQHGYTAVVAFDAGSVSLHGKRADMGACIVLRGSDLDYVRTNGGDSDQLVLDILERARPSRIDIACDICERVDIGALYNYITAQPSAIGGRRTMYISDNEGGSGAYIGSPSSDRRVRVYDKAAQLGAPGARTRVELVVRGRRAHEAGRTIRTHGIAAYYRSHIVDMMRIDDTWYQQVTTGETAPLDPLGRRETDSIRWLIEQVLPTFTRALASHDPRAVALRRLYEEALQIQPR